MIIENNDIFYIPDNLDNVDQLPNGIIVGNLNTGEVKRGSFNPDSNFISKAVDSLAFMFKEFLKDRLHKTNKNDNEEELQLNLAI